MFDVTEERKQIHAELKAELFRRQLSNANNFDKAILTYSAAGLALSLGFLKDFIPINHANAAWLLFFSWALFVAAFVITLFSFIASQIGIAKQLEINEQYYLKEDDSALSERNFFAQCTNWLAWAAGIALVAGMMCSTIFVSVNLEKAAMMTDSKRGFGQDGAPIPGIQRIPEARTRGAPVPGIQKVPRQNPSNTNPSAPPTNAKTATGRDTSTNNKI